MPDQHYYYEHLLSLIYPLHFTCADTFDWSIPLDQVAKMNIHYEQWSKAGKGPNFSVKNPELYIQGLNWVSHWIDEYFFNKVSDQFLKNVNKNIILKNILTDIADKGINIKNY